MELEPGSRGFAYSSDLHCIATAWQQEVHVYDMAAGTMKRFGTKHDVGMQFWFYSTQDVRLEFLSRGRLLVTDENLGAIHVVDVVNSMYLGHVSMPAVRAIAVHEGQRQQPFVAVLLQTGDVQVFDVVSSCAWKRRHGSICVTDRWAVSNVAVSTDGLYLMTTHFIQHMYKRWCIATGECVQTIAVHPAPLDIVQDPVCGQWAVGSRYGINFHDGPTVAVDYSVHRIHYAPTRGIFVAFGLPTDPLRGPMCLTIPMYQVGELRSAWIAAVVAL
jgi:hypothetical protein